jgi:hypothetical protein
MIDPEITDSLLEDSEFCRRFAKRVLRIMAEGGSEGQEVVIQNGEQYFTRFQLERFKKAFIFLCSQDEEFRTSMRKVLRKYLDKPILEPLNRAEMVQRINEFGPIMFKYRGKMCGMYASELYSIFQEYSRREVQEMLNTNALFIRKSQRVHPKTGKIVRTLILDI